MKLIAAYTDLLIMLLYFWDSLIGEITMTRLQRDSYKEVIKHNISNTTDCIGNVRKYLMLVHALSGCNTTSTVYQQGKMPILKLLEKVKAAMEETDVFLQKHRTLEIVCDAGIGIFVILYRGKDSDSLTDLRYLNYMKMASSSRTIRPDNFPPAEQAPYVSCIIGIFPSSRLEHTHGKYLGSKRLGVEVRRCLFGASYDR